MSEERNIFVAFAWLLSLDFKFLTTFKKNVDDTLI
jgi:hypothetical protein